MRSRALLFACLALALLGLAGASFRLRSAAVPVGGEATHVLMARSLWRDGDLIFDHRDVLRGYRTWNGGPAGVALLTPDGGRTLRFAEPVAYALAALPAAALLGAPGLAVFNMALFLAMFAAALWRFREAAGGAALFTAGFLFASASFGYVFRGTPEVFLMACLFFGLLIWKRMRERPDFGLEQVWTFALAGTLLGAAALHRPVLALPGLAALVDLLLGRRFKGAAALALAAALAFGLLAAGQRSLLMSWDPRDPWPGFQRRSYGEELPIESSADLLQAYGREAAGAAPDDPDGLRSLRVLPRNLFYFLAGRHTGVLPYFPFALLALGLAVAGRRDRPLWLLLAALAASVLLELLLAPEAWHGGPAALGNRRFAVLYPLLLLLPASDLGGRGGRWSLVFPYAAAGLWTAAALAGAVVPVAAVPAAASPASASAAVAATSAASAVPSFRALPLELTLLGGGLPGYTARSWGEEVWILPEGTVFAGERHPNGVWVRGASTSEIVVVSPEPRREIRFSVHSLTDLNEMVAESGADRVLVRFDSEAKRRGTPVDLAVEPVASGLGLLPGTEREWVHRFTLTTTDGMIPARRLPGSRDPRYLGVFLDLTGEGL